MNFEEFCQCVETCDTPEKSWADALQSLFWERKGEWEKAHEQVLGKKIPEAAWVHGYLHRKEGDLGNAEFWYTRAGQKAPRGDFAEEWEEITKTLLERYF
ncbi:MAG: hypothetical protein LAT55_06565 [Opitutales bacterium]|nr:hypothetical protein [Opitutales bacterium]